MIKMDTHTKQIFLSGVFVYITTITGLVYNYSILQENHKVRIEHLEVAVNEEIIEVKHLTDVVSDLRTESATIGTMLKSLDNNVLQLTRTTTELSKIAARLDERSKGNIKYD